MPKTIELAIGAALLSQLLLLLAWQGWARPWLVGSLLLLALGYWAVRGGWRRPTFKTFDAAFVPLIVLYAAYALAPPTAPDAIGYHLGLASEWLRTGSLERPAAGVYDAMPHGLEMLFMAAMAIGGLPAASLIHFAFLLATLPLMIRVAARLGFEGRPAALLYFASPVAGAAGTSAYVDAASAFYALATFWLLLEGRLTWAGLTAGFCYAVKMPGGLITLVAGTWLAARGAWGGVACAAAMVAPWLAHAWWLTGNPVAPMLPRLFPSAAFNSADLAGWLEYVRSYGVPWRERWWESTLGGARAQGLLGPAFLAAPVALFSLRRRNHAGLLLAAAVCGAGWFLNSGTRFLMGAAVFIALALAAVLPRPLAAGLALLQVALCWPPVLDRFVPAAAWRLSPEWPWRAALRIEIEDTYLRRVKPEYAVASMVKRHVKPGARVLDFEDAPRAYTGGAEVLASWQYAAARRAAEAMRVAISGERWRLFAMHGAWPRQRLRSIRLEQSRAGADPWAIQEARFWRGGERVFPSGAWELSANPNPWDAPLAFDRNNTSAWNTWEPRNKGMYLEVTGDLDFDRVDLICRGDQEPPLVRVTGVGQSGATVEIAARLEPDLATPAALNRRQEAMRYVRREGFQWILANRYTRESGRVDRALTEDAPGWGLERVDEAAGVWLLRVNPDTGNDGSR